MTECRNLLVDLLFVGFGLLLFANEPLAEPLLRRPRHESNQQRPVEISLRQVLVPALVGGGDLQRPADAQNGQHHYSANNRGVDFLSLRRQRFGQRTSPLQNRRFDDDTSLASNDLAPKRNEDRDIVWSQPDPRKFYSPPISVIKVYKNEALFGGATRQQQRAKRLDIGETLKRSSSIGQRDSIQQKADSLLAASEAAEQERSAESSRAGQERSSPMEARRKHTSAAPLDSRATIYSSSSSSSSSSNNNMVTLIKYVPVLLSVPADSVIPLPAASSSLIDVPLNANSVNKQRDAQVASSSSTQAPAYFGLYKSQQASPIKLIKYHAALADIAPPYRLATAQAGFVTGPNSEEPAGELQLEPDHYQPGAILIQQQPQQTGQGSLLSASEGDLVAANELSVSPSGASQGKFAYLPGPSFLAPASLVQAATSSLVGAGGGGGGGGGSTSKALSAYASRLMSMLRPSTLLSTIGTNQAAAVGQQTSAGQTAPQIYLLAPAEGFAGAHLKVAHSLGRPPSQDSMLNQASRLQHSTAALASPGGRPRGPASWPQYQHLSDGLICVHGAVSHQASGKTTAAAHNQPVLASPFDSPATTTIAPGLSQQSTDASQEQSFEYAPWPSPTTSEPSPILLAGKHSAAATKRKPGAQQSGGGGKESPVRLAQKLHRLKAAKHALKGPASARQQSGAGFDSWDQQQQQQQQPEEELRAPIVVQQKLAASESRDDANINSTDSDRADSGGKDNKTASAPSRRYGNGTISSLFIPFTIRDKIDLPAVRRPPQLSAGPTTATNNPVVFDEPAEGEVELSGSSSGADKPPAQLPDERRVRTTSFVSSRSPQSSGSENSNSNSNRKLRPKRPGSAATNQPEKQIDYRRDAGPSTAGYTLPLLMASSSSAAGAARQQWPQYRPAPPSFRRPPVSTFGSASADSRLLAAYTSGELMGPAASQLVTTSSGLDDGQQPITLASGPTTTTTPAAAAPINQRHLQPSMQLKTPPSRPGGSKSAAESRLSPTSLLVPEGADRLSQATTTTTTTTTTGAADEATVELVVNSSPELRGGPSGSSSTTANESKTSSPTTTTTTTTPTTATDSAGETATQTTATTATPAAAAAAENHATLFGAVEGEPNLYSNERQLGASGSMLLEQDFGRISESLQTNPMDLIDLQNSRSSFELPSQLESLSMLSERQPLVVGPSSSSGDNIGGSAGPVQRRAQTKRPADSKH